MIRDRREKLIDRGERERERERKREDARAIGMIRIRLRDTVSGSETRGEFSFSLPGKRRWVKKKDSIKMK